ncbi:hypothetical protein RclHR1_01170008 [Rhizophagus clarus]|uniref:Gag1-like clamp domain-containing protein n=1 Tax=Rhizophagus clarus TaxID=94130 RepID=A0A2Z6QK46_9GLOM|nr:hypothetical protein RclHR1_01170008 [Rhizophagus clarus]
MAEQSFATLTCTKEMDDISSFQNNDFNVNSNPQFNNGFSNSITNHNSVHKSQHIEQQFTTTQPITSPFYDSQISSTIVPENNDVGSSNGSSGEYGLELWNKRREMWIKGNSNNPESSSNRNNPALANITPNNYYSIYDSLVHDKKRLAKPVPLPYVIKILVSGWKRDGIWPKDQPSDLPSNSNDQAPPH